MINRYLLLVATLLTPLTTQAGLILNGKDADFLLGGTNNTVDFTIESNSGDLLSLAGFKFRITPLTGPVNGLAFVSPQTNPQLSDPSYVFLGNSFATFLGSVGSVSPFPVNDVFEGSDQIIIPPAVSLASEKLLVRLELTEGAIAPVAGNQYKIELENSLFLDETFVNPLPVDSNSFATVTVTSAVNPVPEPASILIWTLLGGAGLAHRRRRTRRAA